MTSPLNKLVDILDIESIDSKLFRGQTPESRSGRVFGGHVIAQAMRAAMNTVDEEREIHSLHAYFLRPGKPKQPIIYDVDPIRDGGSFTTRRVVALQSGEAIFNTSMSFQRPEKGFEHQDEMPDAPAPETLRTAEERMAEMHEHNPDKYPAPQGNPPIDIRPLHSLNTPDTGPRPPRNGCWFRATDKLPDDPRLHRILLAYISDMMLLGTAMLPHEVSFWTPGFQGASLDHALWFYDHAPVDDWIYCDFESSRASGGRGWSRGQFYTPDGRLIAVSAQEGLMRVRQKR